MLGSVREPRRGWLQAADGMMSKNVREKADQRLAVSGEK